MEGIDVEIAKNEAQNLVNLVKGEVQYLCCFNSYVATFDKKKEELEAKLQDVNRIIEKGRGVSSVTYEALQWIGKARSLIDYDTTKEKCFNDKCLNCWRQYRKGKDLEENTQQIEILLERCNFDIVAGAANLPGIKYHSLQNFMHFESRRSQFQDLKKVLEDESCNMIGLHGIGGTGKTSMALQVAAELEGSKFDKVIFLIVSQPPDFKRIQHDLAKQLDLTLREEKEEEHSKKIWSEITNMKEKLLIILDNVWEELDLKKKLGIPSSYQHKNCSVLITTRNPHVCALMKCQKIIQIHILTDKDALDLFLAHAGINGSSGGLRVVAEKIVKKCGGVPIAIVAIARALKNQPLIAWKDALKTLEYHDVNQSLTEAYKCLKLSYDNLNNEKAKEIFVISSLFPEDFQISIQILSKFAMGLGLFGEVDRYYSIRSKGLEAILELIDSSLLLIDNEECVKMHDLVREVALWIRDKDIQWITDLKKPIKQNLRYLVWKNDGFPGDFDGKNLEILMIFLGGSKNLEVPGTFFVEMTRLKVLYLASDQRISIPTLLYSLQSLKDIRTLNLLNLELGDISLLGNLHRLESLWLFDCSIIELPKEILSLNKLRLLEVDECEIGKNNPFEVIERCLQLEELSFVGNYFHMEKACVASKNLSPSTLQRYKISRWNLETILGTEKYGFISRWFYPYDLHNLISEATFKQFVRMAEFLILEEYTETRWKNLIPDIVPMEEGGMNDLIVLRLSSWPNIQCLIDSKNHETNLTAFSKLVELNLEYMDVEDLYRGSLPSGFLEQLETMRLMECQKLRNILFDGKLSLCHLKVMELDDCPKLTSIFQSFTAQSLTQLETLSIENCDSLEHIIAHKSSEGEIAGGDNEEKSYESLFPKLRTLQIKRCGRLRMILPILFDEALASLEEITISDCEQLSYIFDKLQKEDQIMLPSLKKMKLSQVPSFISIFREYQKSVSLSMQKPSPPILRTKTSAFSWAQMCCFGHKSSEETNVAMCKDRVPNDATQQGSSFAFKIWFETSGIILRQLYFNLGHIKKLKLAQVSLNSVSLFTLSMASFILWEKLTVEECDGLKNLIRMEEDDYNDQMMMSCHSVFPKLEKLKILECKELQFLFPSSISIGLQNLKSLMVRNAPKLKYVVGKYHHVDRPSNQNHNVELHFDLSNLVSLCLEDVPMLISICAMNYNLTWPSLEDATLENRNVESFTDDLLVCLEGQPNKETIKELDTSENVMPPIRATQCLSIQSLNNIKNMTLLNFSNSKSLLTLPMASMVLWEKLIIRRCKQLKYIVADEEEVGALMNHKSIFPKLKELEVSNCDALEYLFPAYAFRSPSHLKSLDICNASELKYVFGTSHHENQNIQTYIDFPVLEQLYFLSLPKLGSIYPKTYYLRDLSSLKSFYLQMTPKFNITSLTDFVVHALGGQQDSTLAQAVQMLLQSLETIVFRESKIEEIFNLTHMDTEEKGEGREPLISTLYWLELESLSELKNICVGPKYMLSLNNIWYLEIRGCNKLKVIFSNSILKSLPKLWRLRISSCKELTHIIEENAEDDHLCHQPCFPTLYNLTVEGCDKLRYLFSITVSGILPDLRFLSIKESSNLEHVLIREDETKEMVMMEVLPKITYLTLEKLSSLVSICNEVDFRNLEESSEVNDCPRFSFYETTTPPQVQEKLFSHINMREVKEKQGLQAEQSSTISPEDELVARKVMKNKEIIKDPQQSVVGAPDMTNDEESVGKGMKNGKTMMDPQQPTNGTSKLAKDELVGKDEEKETLKMDPQSLLNTRIVEAGPEERSSRETMDPSSLSFKKKVPVPMSPNLDVHSAGGITSKTTEIFEEAEEEEEEGGLKATRRQRNRMMAMDSSLRKQDENFLHGEPSVPPLPASPKQIHSPTPSKTTYGANIQGSAETTKQPSHEAMDATQHSRMTTTYDTNNALSAPGVKEIVDMMKLEGAEPSMLAEAFRTHPQLRLSSENRTIELLCFSYRVLLNILNILATKTPFTITEADKRLLANYLDDASVLGFDKDWLESVRMKVFNYDGSEAQSMQQVLKDLGNKLHRKKRELAVVHEQEAKAAQSAEMAWKELETAQSHFNITQQEHANTRELHSHLLQECQEILEQRDQCWETIAAKFGPFSF